MRTPLPAVMLSAALAMLGGCSREVTRQQVAEFIDQADEAARKRFAPEICELRGKDFTLHVTLHGHEEKSKPAVLEMSRKLFCQQAGQHSRLRQYQLERKSMDIRMATDRRTATVNSTYVETLPYYEPWRQPSTPDDFQFFQVLESTDESVVGIEDGDIVFLSTRVVSHQTLVGKDHVQVPYQ